ncbi:type II toxin-antitoxin system RelE family toxin [Cyanobium sp. ATX 6F1]|nr:type II toxin-antitoxin system RelE/ParE family toxin [Cyanobium sp. ATX 6F1]MCP9915150.1 type II toxin-antitoxin system RelE/ParE family toxin [Cyanobium sp. ATX 6F1]
MSRLRVGHYRVVYEWQRSELVILVLRIAHRRVVDR